MKMIVRGVPDCFADATRRDASPTGIDVALARRQHQAYVAALTQAGALVTMLPPDERHPDCCFVEDQAVVLGSRALVARSGLPSRRGEAVAVEEALGATLDISRMQPPATLDGGDVMVLRDHVLVGIGGRTNEAAVVWLGALAEPLDLVVTAVRVPSPYLHLKSACSAIAPDVVLAVQDALGPQVFPQYVKVIWVPPEEAYAVNALPAGDVVLVADGYPQTQALVGEAGFVVVPVQMSEFERGDGALTCLQIKL